ncbi:RNA 2',3'-cyclic phosphodiesterase [Dyella dinghuensis]|uniref:RNA 2',3'-cyclic phosphodiesterase n=1 Tax=Dyella dinghuensis TaxID=1920169 RepID=A0A3S0S6B0_9GAMM|nr:2'-5' RNA ligase family protein [Dyella dinghuensis]RUL67169.1 RNA 2',3'-cyclic phosphodiesterase [Dyella dinghuensis]
MPDVQTDLFGPPSGEPPGRHRLFFAVMPDENARHGISRAAGLVEQQHADIHPRWINAKRYHATLNFLGEFPIFPEDIVRKAKAAGENLKAPSFSWTLDYVASFRGHQPPCVLRSTVVPKPFTTLLEALNTALVYAGLQRHVDHKVVPHVTLAYGRRELPAITPVVPITWHVERVLLIYNGIGKGGYQILGSWPLLT